MEVFEVLFINEFNLYVYKEYDYMWLWVFYFELYVLDNFDF